MMFLYMLLFENFISSIKGMKILTLIIHLLFTNAGQYRASGYVRKLSTVVISKQFLDGGPYKMKTRLQRHPIRASNKSCKRLRF